MEQTTFRPTSARNQREALSADVMRFIDSKNSLELKELHNFVLNSDFVLSLQNSFDHQFKQSDLLFKALSHTSFSHELSRLGIESNERLEFLGDSILGTITSTLLWKNYPGLNEGQLSRFRAALVNEESLAKIAMAMNLHNCILLGKGELRAKGRLKSALLSDIFEAVLGAIYLDGGFEAAYSSFLVTTIVSRDIYGEEFFSLSKLEEFDAKTKLQEKTMGIYKSLPTYKAQQLGDQSFVVELYIADQLILKTENLSKKKAERELAYKALKEKLYLNDKGEPLC